MVAIQYYTSEEVAKNNGKINPNIWMIIHNNVYDVTNYMDEHPGGRSVLEEWAGKDGTKAFEEFGHSGDADKEMKKFKIGELALECRAKKGEKKAKATDEEPKKVSAPHLNRTCLSRITCGLLG